MAFLTASYVDSPNGETKRVRGTVLAVLKKLPDGRWKCYRAMGSLSERSTMTRTATSAGFAIFAEPVWRDVFHFGEFTLDVEERRLQRGADVVRLAPKAFDVLVALLRHAGRLVSKDELLAQVWPDTFVEGGILTVHVSALRRSLGDEARPSTYIETVARSGYRFVAPVRRVDEPRR